MVCIQSHNLIHRIKNIKRLEEIIFIFTKYGFGYIIAKTKLSKFMGKRIIKTSSAGISFAENFRKAIEESGPTFIKFGQLLSTRRDILPVTFIEELAKLQDNVEFFDKTIALKIIEQELKCPLTEVFSYISDKPIAAASLSQVYKARLISDNSTVVVKVQRPGIKDIIEKDIEIMVLLGQILETHVEEFRRLNLCNFVQEFKKTIFLEINFRIEMLNILKFKDYFAEDKTVKIPQVYKKYCTSKLLVLEDIEGIKIDRVKILNENGYDLNLLSKRFVTVIAKQIFIYGIVHSDPHPGNIVVLPGNVIGFLDFGMVRILDPYSKKILMDLLIGCITKNTTGISNLLIQFKESTETARKIDINKLSKNIYEMLSFYGELPLEDLQMNVILNETINILSEYKLILPNPLLIISRTFILTESIVRTLSPDFQIMKEITPYLAEFISQRYSTGYLLDEIKKFISNGVIAIKNLPENMDTILNNLANGKLDIIFKPENFDEIISKFDIMITRLALSIITGALFIGSAFILKAGTESLIYKIIGFFGFTVSFIIFSWLIYSILKKK